MTIHGAATASRAALTVHDCLRFKFAPGPGTFAEEFGKGPEELAEIGTAHFPGQPKCFDDAVGDRVGKPFLEPVQRCVELAARAVVGAEVTKHVPEFLRPLLAQLDQCFGQR